MKSSVHGAIVVVAICSWFAISNHCVFAALATNDTAHASARFIPNLRNKKSPRLERSAAKFCVLLLLRKQKIGHAMIRNSATRIFPFRRARSLCIRRELLRRSY
jgi:hypothetical protein